VLRGCAVRCHDTFGGKTAGTTTKSEACNIISFVSNNECEFVAILSYVKTSKISTKLSSN